MIVDIVVTLEHHVSVEVDEPTEDAIIDAYISGHMPPDTEIVSVQS